MFNSLWLAFLSTQLWAVPSILIYVVGVVLALVYWWRHPAVSLLCVIAFVMLLGGRLLASGMQFWVMRAQDSSLTSVQIGNVMGTVSLVQVAISTVAWGLLLTAMFGWRSAQHEK